MTALFTLHCGDSVQLKKTYANCLMKGKKRYKDNMGQPVNWLTRKGVVIWITRNKATAGVKWDNRSSMDSLPVGALELVR